MLEYLVVQLVMLHVADGLGHDDVVVVTGARQLLDSVWPSPSHSLQSGHCRRWLQCRAVYCRPALLHTHTDHNNLHFTNIYTFCPIYYYQPDLLRLYQNYYSISSKCKIMNLA